MSEGDVAIDVGPPAFTPQARRAVHEAVRGVAFTLSFMFVLFGSAIFCYFLRHYMLPFVLENVLPLAALVIIALAAILLQMRSVTVGDALLDASARTERTCRAALDWTRAQRIRYADSNEAV